MQVYDSETKNLTENIHYANYLLQIHEDKYNTAISLGI